MEVFTVGFTQKTAASFFEALKAARIRQLVDVRLNNTSQLAAFAKRDDLEYLLREVCGASYVHEPLLAPAPELLDGYRKRRLSWAQYESGFLDLMASREVERRLDRGLFASPSVLLCSELTAERCHRRLVLEYLQDRWGGIDIIHL